MKKTFLSLFLALVVCSVSLAAEKEKKEVNKKSIKTSLQKKECSGSHTLTFTSHCDDGTTRTSYLIYSDCDPFGVWIDDPRGDCPVVPPTPPDEP